MSQLTFDQFDKIKGSRRMLKKFVSLTRKKRKKEQEIKEINKELKKLVGDGDQLGELLKIFVDNKIQNIPGIEGMTVFVERKVYASNAVKKSEDEEKHSENKKKIIEILREIKLEDFTDDTFSSAALGAYFKEQQIQKEQDLQDIVELDEVIPHQLKGLLKVSEKYSLKGRDSQ